MKNEIKSIIDANMNVPTEAIDKLVAGVEHDGTISEFHEKLTVLDECGNVSEIVELVEETAHNHDIEW